MSSSESLYRARFQAAVLTSVRRVDPDLQLRGSFAHLDFHLLETEGISFSDVDLLGTCRPIDRFSVAEQVRRELSWGGLEVRVSVQVEDYFSELSVEDSRLVSVCEYLRHDLEYQADPRLAAYIRAKASLGVCRVSVHERGSDVATRMATDAAQDAIEVKLGNLTHFPLSRVQDLLLSAGVLSRESRFLWLAIDGERERAVSLVLREISLRSTIHPWLVDLFRRGLAS